MKNAVLYLIIGIILLLLGVISRISSLGAYSYSTDFAGIIGIILIVVGIIFIVKKNK